MKIRIKPLIICFFCKKFNLKERNFNVSKKGYEKPQFIACQHHIVDLFLRIIMDFQLGGSTRSPQLPYDFTNEITSNYKVLKAHYEHDSKLLLNENPGWRDDFRFLYQLCEAFKLNKETGKWPKIYWKNFQLFTKPSGTLVVHMLE